MPSVKSVMSTHTPSEVICVVSSVFLCTNVVPDVPLLWSCVVTCICAYVSMFIYLCIMWLTCVYMCNMCVMLLHHV